MATLRAVPVCLASAPQGKPRRQSGELWDVVILTLQSVLLEREKPWRASFLGGAMAIVPHAMGGVPQKRPDTEATNYPILSLFISIATAPGQGRGSF